MAGVGFPVAVQRNSARWPCWTFSTDGATAATGWAPSPAAGRNTPVKHSGLSLRPLGSERRPGDEVKPGQPETGAEPIRRRQTHARTLAPPGAPEPPGWLLLLSEFTGVSAFQPGPSYGQAVLLFTFANMLLFCF